MLIINALVVGLDQEEGVQDLDPDLVAVLEVDHVAVPGQGDLAPDPAHIQDLVQGQDLDQGPLSQDLDLDPSPSQDQNLLEKVNQDLHHLKEMKIKTIQ